MTEEPRDRLQDSMSLIDAVTRLMDTPKESVEELLEQLGDEDKGTV